MAKIVVKPQRSYLSQPLQVILDGLEQGLVEEIEIREQTLPVRPSSVFLEVFVHLVPLVEQNLQRFDLSQPSASPGWSLQNANRTSVDDVLRAARAYNAGHDRQVHIIYQRGAPDIAPG